MWIIKFDIRLIIKKISLSILIRLVVPIKKKKKNRLVVNYSKKKRLVVNVCQAETLKWPYKAQSGIFS